MPATQIEFSQRGMPDAELLPLMRAGHSSAFAIFMRDNNQRLYRLARGIVGDDSAAEEVVQESYVRAFVNIESFKGDSSLATWLARIVCNEALGRLRRRRPTIDINEIADTLDAGGDPNFVGPDQMSPERVSARREIRRAIERAVDRLPPPFRAVFIMRAIEQMSVAETAGCLGIPPVTVKTRLYRANRLLRRALRSQFDTILGDAFPFLGARCACLVERVLDRLGRNGAAPETSSRARPTPPQNRS
jgi:RNA polymerase sigma-70 factor, ECF subfamily